MDNLLICIISKMYISDIFKRKSKTGIKILLYLKLEVRLTEVCQNKTKGHCFNRYEFVTNVPLENFKRLIIISITR